MVIFEMTNITLGYNIPLKSSKFVKNIRAYVSADNLFCITGYDGLDPEMSMVIFGLWVLTGAINILLPVHSLSV